MKEKINQKSFIQIPLLVVIIVAIISVASVGAGVVLYKQGKFASFVDNVSKLFQESNQEEIFQQELEEVKLKAEVEKQKTQELIKELEQEIEGLERKQETTEENQPLTTFELTKNVGKYVVYLSCRDYYGNIMQGSGIIWGTGTETGKSYILTNYHILENAYWDSNSADLLKKYPCSIGYTPDPTETRNSDRYFVVPVLEPAVPMYDYIDTPAMEILDFVPLRVEAKFIPAMGALKEVPNASLTITDSVPELCSTDEVKIGKEIVVFGYPFGSMAQNITEGVISRGEDDSFTVFISAKIEHGSSGGGVFLKSSACLLGMTNSALIGEIESFGAFINLPHIVRRNYLPEIWKE